MATGKRIRFFRTKIGLTQKQLGEKLGFTGRTSDVRMAQYESEARSPKQDLINQLAQIFHVDSRALTVPDIDTYVGLIVFCQVLFPEKSVGIPFFQQGIFPAFSGHYASLRMRACSIR